MNEAYVECIGECDILAHSIARVVESYGYQVTDDSGMRVSEPPQNVIGILEPREPIQKRFFWKRWEKEQTPYYVGRVWMENSRMGAIKGETLVIEVYGINNIPKLEKLVSEVSEPRGMSFKTVLESEELRTEDYWSKAKLKKSYLSEMLDKYKFLRKMAHIFSHND